MHPLAEQTCVAAINAPLLTEAEINTQLATLRGWKVADNKLAKTFRFDGFEDVMAFVNAVAWIARQQDHHPDMSVHYSRCVLSFSSHEAGGLTLNDFICAARVEALDPT